MEEVYIFIEHSPCRQLSKIDKAHLLISQSAPFAKHVGVVARITHKFALEEGHVEARGVVVDKLEKEHLHGQLVLILQVGLRDFCMKKTQVEDGIMLLYNQTFCTSLPSIHPPLTFFRSDKI